MKDINMTDQVRQVQVVEEPSIVTYDAQELTTEVAFAGGQSDPRSDRNIKDNFNPVESKKILSGVVGAGRQLDDPDIASFDKVELTTAVAFTAPPSFSDRNKKENMKSVDTTRVLQGIVGAGRKLDDPSVTSYDKAEMVTQVAFAGGPSDPSSDRNLKENLRTVEADHTLRGVVGAERKLDEPDVSTYDKAELTTEVAFAGKLSNPPSDRNLKENLRTVEADHTLRGVVGAERKLDEPDVSTYDKAELTAGVAFAGASGVGSDRNIKENFGQTEPRQILSRIVAGDKLLDDPSVSTYDKAELTTEVAFAGGSAGASDRNLKDSFLEVEPKKILSGVIGGGRQMDEPVVSTYDKAELATEVAFAGLSGGSDRNIKENFEQTEPSQILSRIVDGGNAPVDPRVTTYDRVELTARTVFATKGSPIA